MKIFIQIPCFNEELQLEKTIVEIRKSVDPKKYDYEIVIIDDGSSDKTIETAKKIGVNNIISLKRNRGLGYAFNEGRKFASKNNVDVLINTDADNQYKAEYIVSLIEHLTNCHGEWNALFALMSSIPFAGIWIKSKFSKAECDDESR